MQHDPFKVSELISSFFLHTFFFFFFFFTADSSRCIEFERSRQKIREGIRNRIYSRTIILPAIARHSSKEIAILRNSTEDMSQVPLIAAEETSTTQSPTCNMVILEVKGKRNKKRKKKKKKKKNKRKYSYNFFTFIKILSTFLLFHRFFLIFYQQIISFKNIHTATE